MWPRVARVLLTLALIFEVSNAYAPWPCCDNLGFSPRPRYLTEQGRRKSISLYWGSDPAHAASALFFVVLRCAHGYQHVRLIQGNHSLTDLAASVVFESSQNYEDAILALSTGWEPMPEIPEEYKPGATFGLGAPRLEQITTNKIPARVLLHVHSIKHCENDSDWNFYTDSIALQSCDFINARNNYAVVYVIQDSSNRTNERLKIIEARAKAYRLLFEFQKIYRKDLFEKLRAADESFLFIDYGMWNDTLHVKIVREPPCLANEGSTCLPQMDTAIDMRLASVFSLAEYASQLFELAYVFNPSLESLKIILKKKTTGTDIEEAACEWVSQNYNIVKKNWVEKYNAEATNFELAIFIATAYNSEVKKYNEVLRTLLFETLNITQTNFQLTFRLYNFTSFNINSIKNELNYYNVHGIRQRLIGAVVGGHSETTDVSKIFDENDVPVLLYDVAADDADSTKSVWLTTGRSLQTALAIKFFISENNWYRVAVLSDSSGIAKLFKNYFKGLYTSTVDSKEMKKTAFQYHDYTQLDTKAILGQLSVENARVIIVNTAYQDAVDILTAATKFNMNEEKDYVWIVREMGDYSKVSTIKHFTMSFGCSSKNDMSNKDRFIKTRRKMNQIFPRSSWPREAVAVLDAVLTMTEGFNDVLLNLPEARGETHTDMVFRQFGKSLIDLSPIKGFSQDLVYKKHSLDETDIYLDQWHNGIRKSLARWRVFASTKLVKVKHTYEKHYFKYGVPRDGTTKCLVSSGDPYLPTCHDYLWITALVLLIVVPPSIVLVHRAVQRHVRKVQMRILCNLLAQRTQRAAALSDYLVDRSTLNLREELGAGRFGCVMQAEVHVPGSKKQVVAAKELRDHQDENEILREACILASLKHDNIIRLVGVCIDNEPTLVLMELAFFGDLTRYLEKRRYLAETAEITQEVDTTDTRERKEAAHVSAKALTRLAREAASALAYLAQRGVIHRDLRASNCLIDERRSLKLADFGLAREIKATSLDNAGEYACRRRGLFPVLWMAPESLMYGVFSPASDVYSLGVLMYELVTLGARPYGSISPLRVMQYVTSGGKPSLPRDATPQTTALAQLCWQRQPEKRPTAAEVVAYLAESPNTLSPALDYEYGLNDADSGYGDSPSTEILLPE